MKEKNQNTDHKDLEQIHQENEMEFRVFFEGSPDGLVILDGHTFQLLKFNRRAHEMLGYTREEYSKLSIPKDIEVVESPEEIHKHIHLVLKEGKSVFDTRHRSKTGEVLDIAVTAHTALFHEKKRIYGIFHDMTESKRLEEKIRRSAEEWEKTFNSISDLIFTQDNDFTITKVNMAFADALKLKPEEIVGKKCYELLHKQNQPWVNCPLAQTLKDKTTHIEEVDDPNIGLPLLVTTSPIFNAQGEMTGSVHIARDISERRKKEAELKKRLHELEVFYKVTMDRELKIVELKKRVKELEKKQEA